MEKRKEMMELCDKTLEGMEGSPLVKKVVDNLRVYGGLGWRKAKVVLRRKLNWIMRLCLWIY